MASGRLLVLALVVSAAAFVLTATPAVPLAWYFTCSTRPVAGGGGHAACDRKLPVQRTAKNNPQVFALNRRLGGDEAWTRPASTPNGGMWFRTGSYLDMIDQVSYGYHYEPARYAAAPVQRLTARLTTPFGAAGLENASSLAGGWSYFSVSDDWY